MPYFKPLCLLVLMTTVLGCSKESSSGGGAPVLNAEVDFAQNIKEADIGLPKQMIKPQMTTAIKIKLQVYKEALQNNMEITNVTAPTAFVPDEHKSYQIAHEKLQVTLSDKQTKLPLILYLIPRYDLQSKAFSFQIFASLDNISYNVVSLNNAHTAYTGRFMFVGADANKQSLAPFWNPDKKELAQSRLAPYQMWQSGVLLIRATDVQHKPGNTLMPCFEVWTDCKAKIETNNKESMDYRKIWFQPVAPMGYPSFDWSKHEFQTKLREHKYGSPLSEELKQLARAETTDVLKKATAAADIGWFGLPLEKREQINRYQLVSLEFDLEIKKDGQNLVIPENGIAIAEIQGESEAVFQPITMQQRSLDFKVNAPVE